MDSGRLSTFEYHIDHITLSSSAKALQSNMCHFDRDSIGDRVFPKSHLRQHTNDRASNTVATSAIRSASEVYTAEERRTEQEGGGKMGQKSNENGLDMADE